MSDTPEEQIRSDLAQVFAHYRHPWADKTYDALDALVAERDSLRNQRNKLFTYDELMVAVNRSHAAEARVKELEKELGEAADDFRTIAARAGHRVRCEQPDDGNCEACIAESAFARADELLSLAALDGTAK